MAKVCPQCLEEMEAGTRFCPYDGTKLDADARTPRDPWIGELVAGRYHVTGRLGEGGMAQVYLAHHEGLQRDVAIKLLRPAYARNDRMIARFAREARAISRIDHENVVYLLEFGLADEGFSYLAMEYVAGRLLDHFVAQGPMSPAAVTHILSQVAAGLARAHELGIAHRDLKPSNIMLCTRGCDSFFVKILDFGLARPLADDPEMPSLTRAGQVFGTPEYMAPEQWNGHPADMRTDIYALGVTAYELLAGDIPFQGNVLQQMRGHLNTPPPALTSVQPDVPSALATFVHRCIEKSPDDRFQSMNDVLEALGEAWRGLPPPSVRTTYAATLAAPPPRADDELPDVTVYQSHNLDLTWDGPSLCEELQRLHGLREARGNDLIAAVWPDTVPDDVHVLLASIAEREALFALVAERVRKQQRDMEERERERRTEDAMLRSELVESNLALADLVRSSAGRAAGGQIDVIMGHMKQVERRLLALDRRKNRERLDLHAQISEEVGRLGSLETQLEADLQAFATRLVTEVRPHPALRPLLVAYQKFDGAIAAYHALLAMLEQS